MAEDSERRFHSIMDKLFQSPKPKSNFQSSSPFSSPGIQSSMGKKHSAHALTAQDSQSTSVPDRPLQTPICKPWDRGDLMRRLATFKSMTWFGRPKAVSAVNCARRGWINVDMDTIVCESCGARLLFSTPSSWSQQQVEKAALVFSLKLDNGHKLLCPWIDNACDETLMQFPPMPLPALVDGYRKRFSALLLLWALPVVSFSAISYMRIPLLQQFLGQCDADKFGSRLTDTYTRSDFSKQHEEAAASLYYQAQKLISLCGWETHLLPYVVDCKDLSSQSDRDTNNLDSSHLVVNLQKPNFNVYSAGNDEMANQDPLAFRLQHSDPNSVVLDCRLCGARVGLWTFSTVPRPTELYRLTGHSESNGIYDLEPSGTPQTLESGNGNHARNKEEILSVTSDSFVLSKGGLSNSIAGGPPATKQTFKATISLPVIGQKIRARFYSDPDFRDSMFMNQEDGGSDSGNENSCRKEVCSELKRRRFDETGDSFLCGAQLLNVDIDTGEQPDFLSKNQMQMKARNLTREGQAFSDTDGSVIKESVQNAMPEADENVGKFEENKVDPSAGSPVSRGEGSAEVGNTSEIDFGGGICSDAHNTSVMQVSGQEGTIEKDRTSIALNKKVTGGRGDAEQLSTNKAMEFDPIRQHKHFCPWITSTVSSAPGWQQTLNALQRQKEFSHPLPSLSHSVIKVDDPVASVRKLFMSPSLKRKKPAHGSA